MLFPGRTNFPFIMILFHELNKFPFILFYSITLSNPARMSRMINNSAIALLCPVIDQIFHPDMNCGVGVSFRSLGWPVVFAIVMQATTS